jgi:flagellar hook assembly protein FlgD
MTAITDAWNGKDKSGSDCNDGTYFYTYEGSAQNGEEFQGQGTVNIVGGD